MDEIEQVKSKIDIVDLIGGYVTLKRAGRNFKGLCPFHGEKTPSFMVSPELQIFKCFGCAKGGDVFGFLQEVEGVEFGEALKILAEKAGIKLENKFDKQSDVKTELIKINEMAADYYHFLLTKHKVGITAKQYLNNRKIGDKLVEQFRIGFSLSSWDGLYKYLVEKKKIKADLLEKAGLVVKGKQGWYDRFRGRIIFPLTDPRGRVIAFAGRVIPGVEEQKDAPKYINSPETVIYHKSQTLFGFYQAKPAIKKEDRVVVVEGELDMISSFAAGVGETVAIKGSALTEEQVSILGRLTKNVILALDADEAGQEAMKRGIEIAEKAGLNIRILRIEGGKDPDDIARENPSRWKKMLEKTVDVYEFYIQGGLVSNDIKTVAGKRRFSEVVLPVIGRISNLVVKSFYIKRIASLLEVDEESVAEEMERVGKVSLLKYQTPDKEETIKDTASRQEKLEIELLSLVLAAGKEESLNWTKLWLKGRVGGAVGKILNLWWQKQGNQLAAEFVNGLAAELKPIAQTAFLREVTFDRLERDWREAFSEWEKLVARQRLVELTKEIRTAENVQDRAKQTELEEEFVRWTKRLSVANNEDG